MKLSFKRIVLVLPVLVIIGAALVGQQTPSTTLSAQNIKGPLYFVTGGSGANCGFFIGAQGVVVIDAKMTADSAKQMIAEIRKITPLPITHLIITHSDGDHVNGLGGFPAGLEIIAHAQTKKDMEEAFQKDAALKSLLAYLPSRTFTDDFDLKGLREEIRLLHVGPAHTSGDAIVYFPAEKVAFVGDLVFLGRDPLIHRQKGGTSAGYANALRKMLDLDVDTYLAGHNDPLTKSDLRGLLTSLDDKTAKIGDMIKQGKTLDEIKAAFGVQDTPGQPGRRWPSLVEVIYRELTEKK